VEGNWPHPQTNHLNKSTRMRSRNPRPRRHGCWRCSTTERRSGFSNECEGPALFPTSCPLIATNPPRISTTGTSEYKLNGRTVTYSAYNAALVSHNILVKAKNFLVFQGDVEAVASQSPKELTRLIEQISGSLELAPEYEKAKEAQERATENATFNFTKRRGITGELRQFREQKNEATRHKKLEEQKVRSEIMTTCDPVAHVLFVVKHELILRRALYKLYHIEESLKANASEIQKQSRALNGFRADQHRQQQALDNTRAEQAKSKTEVSREERKLKRAEKALETKVHMAFPYGRTLGLS
jgi:structural maintenance of chromosome 1